MSVGIIKEDSLFIDKLLCTIKSGFLEIHDEEALVYKDNSLWRLIACHHKGYRDSGDITY